MSIVEALKRCELFLGLDNKDIQKIVDLPSCQTKTYDDQEIIFKAGEKASHLYTLEEGQVTLVLKRYTGLSEEPQQTVVRTMNKGDVFGWAALVVPYYLMMSAISKGKSKVVIVSGKELHDLFDKDPVLGYEVMNSLLKVMWSRIWNLEQLLVTGRISPFI